MNIWRPPLWFLAAILLAAILGVFIYRSFGLFWLVVACSNTLLMLPVGWWFLSSSRTDSKVAE